MQKNMEHPHTNSTRDRTVSNRRSQRNPNTLGRKGSMAAWETKYDIKIATSHCFPQQEQG